MQVSLKGMTVDTVARLYGVNPSQIYTRRKQARQLAGEAKAATLIPVQLKESVQADSMEHERTCLVMIETQSTRITVNGYIAVAVVRMILERLPMIAPPANARIWIAAGVTDLRRGFGG